MLTGFLCAALAVILLALGALFRRVQVLPARVRALAREEREKDLTALEEATALRVGTITLALRGYEEQMEARLREEAAAAKVRARVVERGATDAITALDAATTLVRELRTLLNEQSAARSPASSTKAPPSTAPPEEPNDPNARATVEGLPPALTDADEPEDEHTAIIDNPRAALTSSANGLRLHPRAAPAQEERPPVSQRQPKLTEVLQ